ncbi:hypothetical protein MMC21_004771 [Puttea exsequens]|nr:hypothetical protein [Puttea exsequens]
MDAKSLDRRAFKDALRPEHQFHYMDDDAKLGSPFSASVNMRFKAPTLLLEEIDHHFRKIECFDDRIYIYFDIAEAMTHAHEEFTKAEIFILVSSHEGCNEDGERNAYLVSEVMMHPEEQVIVFYTARMPWKNTFTALKVSFGGGKTGLTSRHHGRLRPRQMDPPSPSAPSSSSTVTYPEAPTNTPQSANVTSTFSPSLIDKAILPPDTSLSVLTPELPGGLIITCKNCTITGDLNLAAGSFTMGDFNSSGAENATRQAVDFVDDGYIEFHSNHFRAHIELESTVLASADLIDFTAPLPTIALTPFQIPGIASVGPQLIPQVYIGFQVAAALNFSYGFDATIPDGSSLTLNIGNVSKSTQTGFDATTISPLPFQAAISDIALTAVAGFRPQLLLGVSFFEGSATAGAGIFLDAPMLTATITPVTHVGANCENGTSSTADKIFDSLTHISTSAEIGLGVVAEVKVGLGESLIDEGTPVNIVNKTFDLPSSCLSFDAAAKTYGAVPTGTKGAGTTGLKGGAVGGRSVPSWGFVMMVMTAFLLIGGGMKG